MKTMPGERCRANRRGGAWTDVVCSSWNLGEGVWAEGGCEKARQEWRRKRCPQWSLHALMQPTPRRHPTVRRPDWLGSWCPDGRSSEERKNRPGGDRPGARTPQRLGSPEKPSFQWTMPAKEHHRGGIV